MPLPRGIRNLNPGNLEKSLIPWQGEVRPGNDERFCTFSQPRFGLRAIMVLFRRYYYVKNLTTIAQIIARYAPDTENNTAAYVNAVASQMKLDPNAPLLICPETYVSFAQAITMHENGNPPIIYPPLWYDNDTYQAAYAMTVPNAPVSA